MSPLDTALAARASQRTLERATRETRGGVLLDLANRIVSEEAHILAANARDLAAAKADATATPLLKRLELTSVKIRALATAIREVAALSDPLERTLRATRLDDGLDLYQVTAPIGVLLCVYESRPDATIQIASLAIKSGNAVILKGGKEARETNGVLVALVQESLRESELPAELVALLDTREDVAEVLRLTDVIDLVIPRGSVEFVRHVMASTRIPVLGHADGVCHVYIDRSGDVAKARAIVVDAKVTYPAACNAVECVLVDSAADEDMVPALVADLRKAGVEVRGCPRTCALAPDATPATEADFGHEFGDLTVAMRVVDGIDDAIAFINKHGSRHTDAIITEAAGTARAFALGVDTANVFVNASTRFSDGFRYGLGAEVGISTGKTHARGPVGLDGLVTTKWVLLGSGHTVAPYTSENPREFLHEALPDTFESRKNRLTRGSF